MARLDTLLHAVVEGEATLPPPTPAEGEAWIVGAAASGAWAGYDQQIACYQGQQWIFVPASEGMLAFDRTTGLRRVFEGGWSAAPSAPQITGGATIDAEARAAIATIVAALSHYGMMSQS